MQSSGPEEDSESGNPREEQNNIPAVTQHNSPQIQRSGGSGGSNHDEGRSQPQPLVEVDEQGQQVYVFSNNQGESINPSSQGLEQPLRLNTAKGSGPNINPDDGDGDDDDDADGNEGDGGDSNSEGDGNGGDDGGDDGKGGSRGVTSRASSPTNTFTARTDNTGRSKNAAEHNEVPLAVSARQGKEREPLNIASKLGPNSKHQLYQKGDGTISVFSSTSRVGRSLGGHSSNPSRLLIMAGSSDAGGNVGGAGAGTNLDSGGENKEVNNPEIPNKNGTANNKPGSSTVTVDRWAKEMPIETMQKLAREFSSDDVAQLRGQTMDELGYYFRGIIDDMRAVPRIAFLKQVASGDETWFMHVTKMVQNCPPLELKDPPETHLHAQGAHLQGHQQHAQGAHLHSHSKDSRVVSFSNDHHATSRYMANGAQFGPNRLGQPALGPSGFSFPSGNSYAQPLGQFVGHPTFMGGWGGYQPHPPQAGYPGTALSIADYHSGNAGNLPTFSKNVPRGSDEEEYNAKEGVAGEDEQLLKKPAAATAKKKSSARGSKSNGDDWTAWQSLWDLSNESPKDVPYMANSNVNSDDGIVQVVAALGDDDPSFKDWITAGSTFLNKSSRFVTITTEGDQKEFQQWRIVPDDKKLSKGGRRNKHDMDSLTLYNHIPTRLKDTPKFIFIEAKNESPFTHRPPALMITGIYSQTNYRSCTDHRKGCGVFLRSGDLVLVDGRTFRYIKDGMYTAMCFKLVLGRRSCCVGYVRSHFSQLGHVANFVGMVGYISTKPTGSEKPISEKSKTPWFDKNMFNRIVNGFGHLYDINLVSHMRPGENDKRALVCDGMKELPTMEVILNRTNNRDVGSSTKAGKAGPPSARGKKRKADGDGHTSSATSSPGEAVS